MHLGFARLIRYVSTQLLLLLLPKLLICKIKILLPIVQGEIVFACTDVISYGFANRIINSRHRSHAKTLLAKQGIHRFGFFCT